MRIGEEFSPYNLDDSRIPSKFPGISDFAIVSVGVLAINLSILTTPSSS